MNSVTSLFMADNNKLETEKHVSRLYLIKAITEGRWDDACTIAYNDESYARIPDPDGYLPLHIAVKLGCPPRLAVLLITAHPTAIQTKDKDGSLPLHLAVKHHKGRLWINIYELTTILFQAYPGAIQERDRESNLPIHLALRYRGPDDMIRFLLDKYPESLTEGDRLGNLPLHLAIQFGASYVIVFLLMKLNPEATKALNNNGATALHKVAFFNSSMEIFELVLNAYPDAASIRDRNHNLPIHFVYLNAGGPPDEAKLRMWLKANPLALSCKNKSGCTPMMMFQRPQDNNVVEYL